MFRRLMIVGLAFGWILVLGVESASAQPARQIPTLRPYNPPSTPAKFPPANPRVVPQPNTLGSQDLYAKNGYPKMLGDAVETGGSSGGGATGSTGAGGGAQFGGGFQGNTGNQIGQNSGGTIFGGLFGGGGGGGGGVGGGGGQLGGGFRNGFTGGGFSGMSKGFGFGGTPDFTATWINPR